MNTTNEEQFEAGGVDKLLVALAAAAVIAGLVGWYMLEGQATVYRFVSVAAGLIVGGFIFTASAFGKRFWKFVSGARMEFRKVVWPMRKDAIGQAIAVIIFSFVMGFFFWGLDFFLAQGVDFLRGVG